MSEREKLLGKDTELRLEADNLKLQIKDRRAGLRDLLDPVEEPEDLDGQRIAMKAVEMAALIHNLKRVNAKRSTIRDELGDQGAPRY
ncbi:MAG: hypothetical protein ABFD97_12765 [Syntrophobacter sp.]